MALLELENIAKAFGRTVALEKGDLSVEKGEVHVLIGSNGCGKSTLCKIVAGAVGADAGHMVFDGREGAFADPRAAAQAGVAVFYQELSLIPHLTVAQNIALGQESTGFGLVDDKAARRTAAAVLDRFRRAAGSGLTLDALIGDLTTDQRQIVEIAKILARRPKLVIFDEATSSLDGDQVSVFFDIVRELKFEGLGIIFISHRMDEVFAIGDRVTVMRDGRSVGTLELAATDRSTILDMMVGGTLAERPPRESGAAAAAAETVLSVTDALSLGRDVEVKRGEILGLGGLHGQGQSKFLRSLFGTAPAIGEVKLEGRRLGAMTPIRAMRAGMGYVSGDRATTGVFLPRPIIENMALARLAKNRSMFLRPRAFIDSVSDTVERLKLRFAGYSAAAGTLSGGNQQKVVVARWLATRPRVLLLDDPTKGIDVGAKADLYKLMDELCAGGTAIILYSSEDDELLTNADRVLVFNSGRITRELAGDDLNAHALYQAAYEMDEAA